MKFIPLLALAFAAVSCKTIQSNVAFYNVENLYDTINQPHDDEEFLPNGKNEWTSERYLTKLDRLNQVLDSMGHLTLVGFGEIENRQVIEDLVNASKNRKHFKTVHFDSPDLRGVDVGLIYNPKLLKLQDEGFLRFNIENPYTPYTRDILWAKFTHKKDTLFAMVNHWPSRRGGQDASEVNRIIAATHARQFIDSVMQVSPKSQIVFMGDLNDYPQDKAPKMIAEKLNPMITKTSGKFGGSYNYRSEWDVLDHIMVSPNAFDPGAIQFVKGSGEIISSDFLMDEYKGERVPKRNYAGSKYLDGYSDHLPVRVKVSFK